MNQQQFLSIVREVLQIIGTMLVSFHVAGMTDTTWEPIAGAALMIAPAVWGWFNHTETNAVAIVSDIAKNPQSPVKGVVTEATPEGRALAQSIASPTVAVAGSQAAADVATR